VIGTLTTMDAHFSPHLVSNLAAPAVLAAVHAAFARGAIVDQFSDGISLTEGDRALGSSENGIGIAGWNRTVGR
jgi:hypothetical protein